MKKVSSAGNGRRHVYFCHEQQFFLVQYQRLPQRRLSHGIRQLCADTRSDHSRAWHGMAWFAMIGPLNYWYGIPKNLTANGATVYVTQVASFNSAAVRGE